MNNLKNPLIYPSEEMHRVEELRNGKGITLRDYFAAKAMQSALDHTMKTSTNEEFNFKVISDFAYTQADAMLKERDNEH